MRQLLKKYCMESIFLYIFSILFFVNNVPSNVAAPVSGVWIGRNHFLQSFPITSIQLLYTPKSNGNGLLQEKEKPLGQPNESARCQVAFSTILPPSLECFFQLERSTYVQHLGQLSLQRS
eukprot:gb/GECG01001068.1/.p1 GENE.gb/GECG01001068.1/~~gb/GECG01001068.1/.p1  ORF type:complete len:120 (+),score=8.38 gb/GECG01001068.1/:1-360(+)